MFESDEQKEMSLRDVLSELMESDPSEYHEVSLVAKKIVHYFRRPAHEINVTSIKEGLRFFPLYLSFERLPFYLIDIMLKDADRLIYATEVIQKTIAAEQEACHARNRDVSLPGIGDQLFQAFSGNCHQTCAASSCSYNESVAVEARS